MGDPNKPMTAAEYQALREHQHRPHKYGAKKVHYNGQLYPSRLEAATHETLDNLMHSTYVARRPVRVARGPRFVFRSGIVYVADFEVEWSDGRVTIIETKGFETPTWRLKRRLMADEFPDVDLRVVKRAGEIVEIAMEGP